MTPRFPKTTAEIDFFKKCTPRFPETTAEMINISTLNGCQNIEHESTLRSLFYVSF